MKLNLTGSMVGSYRVVGHVAYGGHTEVYLAEGPDGARVIVKALNAGLRLDEPATAEQMLWHFENELGAYGRVGRTHEDGHAHVVGLVEHGVQPGQDVAGFHYLVFEYMAGGDLGTYCKQQRILSPEEVVRYFGPVCDALSWIHQRGVIHCDIKPANLLLDDAANPKVMKLADFGVAKVLVEGYAQDRTLVGTSPYAAPEHKPGADPGDLMQPVDTRADVFALAMTIFYAMTGTQPKLSGGVLCELPFHPSLERHRRRLTDVLYRATSARVEDRHASVAEFWDDFKDYKALRASARKKEEEVTTVNSDTVIVTVEHSVVLETAGEATVIRLPDNVHINIVTVKAGRCMVGSEEKEIERLADTCPEYLREYAGKWLGWEHPRHPVEVEPFRMGTYPVTVKQWRTVASKLPPASMELEVAPCGGSSDEQPVTMVTWEQAREFCVRLSLYLRRDCRLPSEAEWEYACRGGSTDMFGFAGPLDPARVRYSGVWPNDSKGTARVRPKAPSVVGSVGEANAFGLHDMHGNVWEWCADAWHDGYAGAPADGRPWEDVSDALRVARGGSFLSFGISCRSASRASFLCFERAEDIGFRIVVGER